MFGFFGHSKYYRELEAKLQSIQVNLENNYKDEAISAKKECEVLLEQYKEEGKIKPGEYDFLSGQLRGYAARMEGYNHTNISNFLKERY
ncbi:MAG: hypothetical protein ACI4C1_05455 [Lachnospiraceae bacterium]